MSRERVVLLHGLARTARSLRRMAASLEAAGYEAIAWDYPSRHHPFADLVARFRQFCISLGPGPVTHFVGHSLGGLVIRAGLAGFAAPFPLGRIVLVGVPNRGVLSVARLQRHPLTRRLPGIFGQVSHRLGRDAPLFAGIGWPAAPVGAVAGTRRFHPVNPSAWVNLAAGAAEPGDGTVELDSALPPEAADRVSVDAAHSFLPGDPRVIAATLAFLQRGTFGGRAAARPGEESGGG